MEWQPIETAPKDGTRVLVCDTGIDRWVCSARAVSVGADSHEVVWLDDADSFIDEQPTHWMPLPTPPNREQSNAG
jgi:hypothetical protein